MVPELPLELTTRVDAKALVADATVMGAEK
jgi:hypothetical protein